MYSLGVCISSQTLTLMFYSAVHQITTVQQCSLATVPDCPFISNCQLVLLVWFFLAAFVRFVVSGGRIPGHNEDASVVGLQHGEPAWVVVLARLVVQTPEQLRLQQTQLVLQRRRVLLQTRLLV